MKTTFIIALFFVATFFTTNISASLRTRSAIESINISLLDEGAVYDAKGDMFYYPGDTLAIETFIPGSVNMYRTITKEISAIGVWPLVSGDTEMDTDGRDIVPVECSTELYCTSYQVKLRIYYSCSEHGGNHTRYKGWKTIILYSSNRKISGISANGGLSHYFNTKTIGQNHRFNSFSTYGTYWNNFYFRVDGRGRHDNNIIGVKGNLSFRIYFE